MYSEIEKSIRYNLWNKSLKVCSTYRECRPRNLRGSSQAALQAARPPRGQDDQVLRAARLHRARHRDGRADPRLEVGQEQGEERLPRPLTHARPPLPRGESQVLARTKVSLDMKKKSFVSGSSSR